MYKATADLPDLVLTANLDDIKEFLRLQPLQIKKKDSVCNFQTLVTSKRGRSAIQIAAELARRDIFQLLLRAGADPNERDNVR
jgi:ankyrin repeat protein